MRDLWNPQKVLWRDHGPLEDENVTRAGMFKFGGKLAIWINDPHLYQFPLACLRCSAPPGVEGLCDIVSMPKAWLFPETIKPLNAAANVGAGNDAAEVTENVLGDAPVLEALVVTIVVAGETGELRLGRGERCTELVTPRCYDCHLEITSLQKSASRRRAGP